MPQTAQAITSEVFPDEFEENNDFESRTELVLGGLVNSLVIEANLHGDNGSFNNFFDEELSETNAGAAANANEDVDFYSFTGLTPGQLFRANVDGDSFGGFGGDGGEGLDTILGVFDSTGTLIDFNDNKPGGGGFDLGSEVAGIVGADGTVNLAVTGFDDFDFDGISDVSAYGGGTDGHFEVGFYDLAFEVFTLGGGGIDVPEFICGGVICLLPNEITDGTFVFDLDVPDRQPVLLDPPVAVGYEYQITGGSAEFFSVVFPAVGGDNEFEIVINGVVTPITAGDIFNFDLGVLEFIVQGIDISEAVDPGDTTAFPALFTFDGTNNDPFSVGQTPITFDTTANAVPEPATLALLGLGLAGIGFGRKKRK